MPTGSIGSSSSWATLPYDAIEGNGGLWDQHVTSNTSGHSCEGEVSVMLYLWPDAVRKDALVPGQIVEATQARIDKWGFVAETGKVFVLAGLDRTVEYLKDFMER